MLKFLLIGDLLSVADLSTAAFITLTPEQLGELSGHARRSDEGVCTLTDTSHQTLMIERELSGHLLITRADHAQSRFRLRLNPEHREAFAGVLDAARNHTKLSPTNHGMHLAMKVHEFQSLIRARAA